MRRSVASSFVVGLAVVVLTGCGGDEDDPAAATSAGSTASTSASASGSGSSTSASASGGTASVVFEDQSGDGTSAVVDRVVIPQDGFVVVAVRDGGVLGSAAVPAGTSEAVQVPLQPSLTRDTELDATLYLDTDGNGAFDAAADHALPVADRSQDRDRDDDHDGDPSEDRDQDRDQDQSHEVVTDDAHYRVG